MSMKFRLSSEFGVLEEVRDGRIHNGIDLAMPEGTELRAIADAVVERIVDYGDENIGKGVILRLEDGTNAVYGHLSDVTVEVGQTVKAGDLIAYSGNTGFSTGPHLHFALNKDGEWLDPTPLAAKLAEISGDVESGFLSSILKGKGVLSAEQFRENIRETTKEFIIATLQGIGDAVMDLLYSVTLIGTGTLIILRVVGYTPANKYIGLLPTTYVLLRYMFGGV